MPANFLKSSRYQKGRILACCLFALAAAALAWFAPPWETAPPPLPENPERIISLAPSITETLFALGMGEKIAGVTSHCEYPPEAAKLPVVGGFRDIDPEAALRLAPDLIILPKDMEYMKERLEGLGLPVFLFNYRTLKDYAEDTRKLGKILHADKAAEALVLPLEKMKTVQSREQARVLFALLSPADYAAPVSGAVIMGRDGFYDELMGIAGGKNAYKGAIAFPSVSLEAMIGMKPDLLVISAPGISDRELLAKNWRHALGGLLDPQILILDDPGDTVPGPRSLHALQKLRNAISGLQGASKQ